MYGEEIWVPDRIWVECSRKQKFKREEWAEERLASGIECGHYTENYHVYPCRFCTSYHIGRKPLEVLREVQN